MSEEATSSPGVSPAPPASLHDILEAWWLYEDCEISHKAECLEAYEGMIDRVIDSTGVSRLELHEALRPRLIAYVRARVREREIRRRSI